MYGRDLDNTAADGTFCLVSTNWEQEKMGAAIFLSVALLLGDTGS